MTKVTLYIVSVLAFLALDITWVSMYARSAFESWSQSVLSCEAGASGSRMLAAVVAYSLLVMALCIFVVRPGQSWQAAFLRGAFLGLCMYGVFDFTNKGILGDCYPWRLLAVDVMWGTLAVGTAAGAGAAFTTCSN